MSVLHEEGQALICYCESKKSLFTSTIYIWANWEIAQLESSGITLWVHTEHLVLHFILAEHIVRTNVSSGEEVDLRQGTPMLKSILSHGNSLGDFWTVFSIHVYCLSMLRG